MIGFRTSASGLVAIGVASGLLMAPGCGTDARGVDDCRNIEQARCVAAANCVGANGSGSVVVDVGSCQRFYRDQCLHGTTTASPGAPAVDACVGAIQAAGECAKADTECVAPMTPESACKKILHPELLIECRFLTPEEVTGEGGTTGSPDGTGGSGDATGTGEGGNGASAGVGAG
jgi:hypothetical protein